MPLVLSPRCMHLCTHTGSSQVQSPHPLCQQHSSSKTTAIPGSRRVICQYMNGWHTHTQFDTAMRCSPTLAALPAPAAVGRLAAPAPALTVRLQAVHSSR